MNVGWAQAEIRKARLLRELNTRLLRERYENDFLAFVEAAWPTIDSTEYKSCWAIDALCEHLQAVTEGEIRHLLVNFPPRCAKTLVTSICYPAWTWARDHERDEDGDPIIDFRSGAQVRFLCGSYNHELSLANSNKTRRLILSPWYQSLWGRRFRFRQDQNTKTQFDNSEGGSRIASSVSGSLLGIGGDIIIIDDPHNTDTVESEADRATALQWWKEISTTRLNDPKQTPIIVIMQRLHEEDVSGVILSSEWSQEWTHLCIPMSYEWPRHCVTSIGWQDPRGLDEENSPLVVLEEQADGNVERVPRDSDAQWTLEKERQGALMWPERFGPKEIERITAELGPYMASGRLQQLPVSQEGSIFKSSWWEVWNETNFPKVEYVIASLDSAFTEKEQNDPSALTVWGVFIVPGTTRRAVILIDAWRKHLLMHGDIQPREDHEISNIGDDWHTRRRKDTRYMLRAGKKWGLVEWVAYTCRDRAVDKLLIEGKASGLTAAQEMLRLYSDEQWSVEVCPVKTDKVARALAVQPTFSQGKVWAPVRDWSELVIREMESFPKGKRDDLTDSATQALSYLRSVGMLTTDDEAARAELARVLHKPQAKALYPV